MIKYNGDNNPVRCSNTAATARVAKQDATKLVSGRILELYLNCNPKLVIKTPRKNTITIIGTNHPEVTLLAYTIR